MKDAIITALTEGPRVHDRTIANRLGCSARYVSDIRQALGIPSTRTPRNLPSIIREKRAAIALGLLMGPWTVFPLFPGLYPGIGFLRKDITRARRYGIQWLGIPRLGGAA